MEWKQVEENWVLTPSKPQGVIHFLGGAFLATAPHISYGRILECLAKEGYAIVATPFLNTFDHKQIAIDVHRSFQRVRSKLFLDYFPVYGLGHSMGCKIHLLVNGFFSPGRAGNILMAYNNYGARQSIPLFKELSGTIPEMSEMEFEPSPAATRVLVEQNYKVTRNLLIRFSDDDLDEIASLNEILERKFSRGVQMEILPGNHLTCTGGSMEWSSGDTFSPVDAIAQWFKQEIQKDSHLLDRVILRWLSRCKHESPVR